jgi:hypothetical protein
LEDNSFYSETEGGAKLVDWFSDILSGKPGAHVGM